jgi:hypothetical protein
MPKDDDFFETFRSLHAMEAKAPLNKAERADYDKAKERFAEAICAAQKLAVKPGQTARKTFRVAMLFRLKLTIGDVVHSTSTLDVSGSGFSAALTTMPAVGTELTFEMTLTKSEVVKGQAAVAEVLPKGRAFFRFVDIRPASAADSLEHALFDEILRQLVSANAKKPPA